MTTYWCHNSKTGEIFSYQSCGELTNFSRGTYMAYGDYLTTGLESRKEAEEWAKEWVACHKCKATRHIEKDGKCQFCGSELRRVPIS